MVERYLVGEFESRTKEKVLSLKSGKRNSGIYSDGKLYAAISTKNPNFKLSTHTQGEKAGLSMGLVHGADGIQEHVGFIEFERIPGQCDIGGMYHISRHLDFLSAQTDRLNRSLEVIHKKQDEILECLHISLLASLRHASCDFVFALKNLDKIVEKQLQSIYVPAIAAGIREAEKVLHEKALLWDKRIEDADRIFDLWKDMPEKIEGSIYFKSLFLTAVGHAAQALLMGGNEHALELSRLKLSDLASPIVAMLQECKNKKEWIHSRLSDDYDSRCGRGYAMWHTERPDVAISKLMEHADRMLEAIDYLVNLSFVDCVRPDRACMVLEVSEDLQNFSVTQPLAVPDAIKRLVMGKS
ncbi:hypothetical protein D9M70_199030 [compost metagenome]